MLLLMVVLEEDLFIKAAGQPLVDRFDAINACPIDPHN